MSADPVLMTTGEVARTLRVDPSTVTRWAREGRLEPVVLPSGRNRFRREDVDALLGTVAPETPDPEPATAAVA